jgi:hypothetical protein
MPESRATRLGRRRVPEGVRPCGVAFEAVGLVDEQVGASSVLDHVQAGASVGGVDHR